MNITFSLSLSTASSILSISPKHVREISDPILVLLTQLHKLVFLTQLPPSPTPSARWSLVQAYKRWLFQHESSAPKLKAELHHLVGGSGEGVVMGEEHGEGLDGSRLVHCAMREMAPELKDNIGPDEPCTLTYETLQRVIESLALEHGYYQTTPA
jgi:NIMA (never in mitosis gene a)-related kinase